MGRRASGRSYEIAVDTGGKAFRADGGDQPVGPPDRSAWMLIRLDGTPLARVGRFGNYHGEFEMTRSIAVDAQGAAYVGDISGTRVRKFLPSDAPARDTPASR